MPFLATADHFTPPHPTPPSPPSTKKKRKETGTKNNLISYFHSFFSRPFLYGLRFWEETNIN